MHVQVRGPLSTWALINDLETQDLLPTRSQKGHACLLIIIITSFGTYIRSTTVHNIPVADHDTSLSLNANAC